MIMSSLSQKSIERNAVELQLQDTFAHMLGTKLSRGDSIKKRYTCLQMHIDLLACNDDQLKDSVSKVDCLKDVLTIVARSVSRKKIPDFMLSFLNNLPIITPENKKQFDDQITECKNWLADFLKAVNQENEALYCENNQLKKSYASLEQKYNATFIKNFFDIVHDKKTMQFFAAVIGLVVFMNASTYWDLDPFEHIIATVVGLSGFFSVILSLYN